MVRQSQTSRVTPKGSAPQITHTSDQPQMATNSGSSPIWLAPLMFACLALGMIMILLNYMVEIEALGTPSNWYLLGGLLLVLVGITSATRLR